MRSEIIGQNRNLALDQGQILSGVHVTCDLDDVLGDYMQGFLNFYNAAEGTRFLRRDLTSYSLGEHLGRHEDRITEYVRNFSFTREYANLPVTSGAYQRLDALKQAGAKLTILTSRSKLGAEITEDWVSTNYSGIFDDIVCTNGKNSKGELARRLASDLHIDDAPKYITDVNRQGIPTIIYSAPWNQRMSQGPNSKRANNFCDVEEIVKYICGERPKQFGKLKLLGGRKW